MSAIPLQRSASDSARQTLPAAIHTRLADLRGRVNALDAEAVLRVALHEFAGRIAVVSSFGAESAVLLHLVAKIDPAVPILFLNTGKLFGETLRYRDRLQDHLGLSEIRAIGPHPHDRALRDPEGTLWSRDPDSCCQFRKVSPMRRALQGFDAQVTGRKRFQTAGRIGLETVEYAGGTFRFNPLADWTQERLAQYSDDFALPKHPLVNDGYPSIGCMPCTRRVREGEDYRAGRWAAFAKDECGIHTGMDGDGI